MNRRQSHWVASVIFYWILLSNSLFMILMVYANDQVDYVSICFLCLVVVFPRKLGDREYGFPISQSSVFLIHYSSD